MLAQSGYLRATKAKSTGLEDNYELSIPPNQEMSSFFSTWLKSNYSAEIFQAGNSLVEYFPRIKESKHYINREKFAQEIFDNHAKFQIYIAPSGFGKTFILSRLLHAYPSTQPTIFLSLKQIQGASFEEAMQQFQKKIAAVISSTCQRYRITPDFEMQEILQLKAKPSTVAQAVKSLASAIYAQQRIKVDILIDDYDQALQTAYCGEFYREMREFLKDFFMFPEVASGISQIICVGTLPFINDESFDDYLLYHADNVQSDFGFSKTEVQHLLTSAFGEQDESFFEQVEHWYGGYQFDCKPMVFHPQNIIRFIKDNQQRGAGAEFIFKNYTTTADNIIKDFLLNANPRVRAEFQQLVETGKLTKSLSYHLSFDELHKNPDHIWQFLLASGYLSFKYCQARQVEVTIPNQDLRLCFRALVKHWFPAATNASKARENPLLEKPADAKLEQGQRFFTPAPMVEAQPSSFADKPIAPHSFFAVPASSNSTRRQTPSSGSTDHVAISMRPPS